MGNFNSKFSLSISISILLLLINCNKLIAQREIRAKIIGCVTDSATSQPIADVNVYLSTTTFGAATNAGGNYVINNIPSGSYTLIISHVGYQWQSVPVNILSNKTVEINVSLSPKVIYSNEVVITAEEPEKWKEELEIFKEEFLGTDKYSEYCKILNPEVLNFNKDEKEKIFTASTDSILVVDNYALGYRIEIILAKFELRVNQRIQYFIYPRFQYLAAKNEREKEVWESNRLYSYRGSLKHFLSAATKKDIEKEGFKLLTGTLEQLVSGSGTYLEPAELKLVPDDFTPYLRFYYNGFLEIEYYNSVNNPPSFLKFNSSYALIDTLGNIYNKFPFDVYGYWTQERLSQLLPLDYFPQNNF